MSIQAGAERRLFISLIARAEHLYSLLSSGNMVDFNNYYDETAAVEMRAEIEEAKKLLADKAEPSSIAYPTKLPEFPDCVWLRDGRKIAIGGECVGRVWLRIEPAQKIQQNSC